MITEDQLEQLAIQWLQDTGGENIEHRTPITLVEKGEAESRQLSRHHGRFGRKKDHRMGRPFKAWYPVGDGISLHLQNIYAEGELQLEATHKEFLSVQQEGARGVRRRVDLETLPITHTP